MLWAATEQVKFGDTEPPRYNFAYWQQADLFTVNRKEETMSDNKTENQPPQSDYAATYPEKPAPVDCPIDDLAVRRWSPRAFEEGRPVERDKLLTLLEAGRWAPSCFNEQPWRYLVFDGSDAETMAKARACLVEGNAWALKAPV